MPTLATSLLHGLKDHGAREIFGIPGDFVLPFFKVIEESAILPYYTLSHEPGVGFAADAAARYHSGLGVAVVTFGAGAFNLVNPIAGAYAERSPVVVVAGAPGAHERASGFGVHHQAGSIDTQTAVFREITVGSTWPPRRVPREPRHAAFTPGWFADFAAAAARCRTAPEAATGTFGIEVVDDPARDTECFARADVLLLAVDRPGQDAFEPVEGFLVAGVAVWDCAQSRA